MKKITLFTYIAFIIVLSVIFSLGVCAYSDTYSESEDALSISSCIIIAAVCGLIAAIITVLVLRGQLKSVKKAQNASRYVNDRSFVLTENRDIFLYSTISKTPKPQNNSSKSR